MACGFVYQHSDADAATADEHTQLRWAMLAGKHLSKHLLTPVDGGRTFFFGLARMGNGGRFGVHNASAGLGQFAAHSPQLVVEAQRGDIFGLCKTLALECTAECFSCGTETGVAHPP